MSKFIKLTSVDNSPVIINLKRTQIITPIQNLQGKTLTRIFFKNGTIWDVTEDIDTIMSQIEKFQHPEKCC
ncbi:hypothetical protein A6A19_01495 [Actinobacillus delphinicola]|uniref:Uncharacterized protein n=1 Tax=Actinobacillus delphinicola TaxID=51161 RepID=A0A448TW18_9PAST|nr:hypothetical protein [Actinobacillus delphinicola]MDG6896701.1 hypothetical protein [Actinobacillus delphinicola]VEJ10132.1 Uncharacterised protein [Actinobacillus delphinicola]